METEGVIKFRLELEKAPLGALEAAKSLLPVRDRLRVLNLLGEDAGGYGFGNLSQLAETSGRVVVSASQTSQVVQGSLDDFTEILDYSLTENWVKARGPKAPSSEVLTHLLLYAQSPRIGAVIHVHHHLLWKHCLAHFPATDEGVEYGTLAMANEMKRIWRLQDDESQGVIAMTSHLDGVVVYASDLSVAEKILLNTLKEATN